MQPLHWPERSDEQEHHAETDATKKPFDYAKLCLKHGEVSFKVV